ncbi:MAG: deoxyribodipyrimidine photo-lyase, partial [Rhodomicrobium sp.]|nr:deoxyribodipyrimidine photo-lyase [Rhodomicrobium sp.]
MSETPVIVWFRRSLRLADHPALDAAAASGSPVIPVFVLDDETAGPWRPGGASRWWLAGSLKALDADLKTLKSRLVLRSGDAVKVLTALADETGAETVYSRAATSLTSRPGAALNAL